MAQFLVNPRVRSAGSAGGQGCNNIATFAPSPIRSPSLSSTTSPRWTAREVAPQRPERRQRSVAESTFSTPTCAPFDSGR